MSQTIERSAQQHRPLPGQGRLVGKVALVTGGGSGIGRAAALAFAREGAAVVLAGRREAELKSVADEIIKADGRAVAIPTDVSQSDAAEKLIKGAIDCFGRLDAAFNNAGTEGVMAPITKLTAADFDHTMSVNLRGTWLLVKHEVEAMLAQGTGGAIVNTSSWLAKGAAPGSSIYSASKGALDAMVRAVALEVAANGIRINNVEPGVIDTPMFHRLDGGAVTVPLVAHTPAKRLGQPEDVGDVAVWLCTPEARFITGHSLPVDGGFTIAGMR
ncbi:SDR family NAD(P)-dependent oxidoreductase [Pyxidicoccus xibeiensis]|uniref:SDR family NAD(P)-dependent oxidoreductase n=1 Tax=Pyxidicoccus xibeiensis TaxID=2906759 RepID=UPI0020A6FD4B|nr:glucose 1-dehydrogenase [Pyxidicoccus xibeiensis]MCP3142653.1 glucose 1-dehydrogenase [Pyxidicoccus xibeiensis]